MAGAHLVDAPSLVVTGANGHVGRSLLRAWRGGARALVRSERAASALAGIARDVRCVDLRDAGALADAARGARAWVHLVGILGAEPHSRNACLASKGRADATLLAGSVPATILRVPMVLGPGEVAAAALRAQASAPLALLVRGGATQEQPIDTRDVVAALAAAAADASGERLALDLAGPESLTHRELVARVARALGRTPPRVVPVPAALAFALAALLERLAEPPLTRAMLGVLEHDDAIDPHPAARRLGIALTPLAETLAHTFAPEKQAA